MKILITTDSHDRWDYLSRAIEIGNDAGCNIMLFSGDFVAPTGVAILTNFNGQVHFVRGNNEGELVRLTRKLDAEANCTFHVDVMDETFDGLRFYMNHYPDIVRNAALTGNYDVCVYGHNHLYHDEVLDNGTRLLNAGEVCGNRTNTPTAMIFDTTTKTAEKIILI